MLAWCWRCVGDVLSMGWWCSGDVLAILWQYFYLMLTTKKYGAAVCAPLGAFGYIHPFSYTSNPHECCQPKAYTAAAPSYAKIFQTQ